ncbi:hypothetical protein DEJ49_15910 [Streptomyces venezuelae]|uniref:Uncharacterized protein n=1 Tax=Streptomyces venezuelae TaxID=54571 RepID=A0A5P2CJ09_STRVZ|nr:hypothetical protein DEJ49_15910 [Streptomyces venezuelae]
MLLGRITFLGPSRRLDCRKFSRTERLTGDRRYGLAVLGDHRFLSQHLHLTRIGNLLRLLRKFFLQGIEKVVVTLDYGFIFLIKITTRHRDSLQQ